MKIVYMGTPDFAIKPLELLLDNGFDVVGVVTMPDKPAGRGHRIQFSAVKQFALERNLKILQPTSLKNENFIAELKSLKAEIQVVVAFRMLPEIVWNMPKMGTVNMHSSLLPQYRGAAPINWAIINGETQTGVTTFLLQHEIDTGNIIFQQNIDIEPNDNAGTLHDKLGKLGAELLVKTIKAIKSGNYKTIPQPKAENIKLAPKIFKDICKLDFSKNCMELHNLVRGLSPTPAAWFEYKKGQIVEIVKVYETKPEVATHNFENGQLLTDGKKYIKIAVNDGFLQIEILQLAGKKRMSAQDLLRGYRFD
ncbi:MAG: methionyl-tRNA formyltransferase [Prevotellaceae bacterium]|jgi:methionyl-tRNA formyltransferase|nr:methionyl-tRNA formyltransferase [Prevotellaceae bacterium]